MSEKCRYDYIIAGAGAFGLSLLWYLLESDILCHKRILLVDKNLSPKDDKTWCFWDNDTIPMKDFYHKSWDSIQVQILSDSMTQTLKKHQYHCLKSSDYTEKILTGAKSVGTVDLLESDIIDFTHNHNGGVMSTGKGTYEADFIFQSVLKPRDFHQSKIDLSTSQHFLGWEIETDSDLFDPGTATIMDFEVDQSNGFTFVYLLPFSMRSALVEYTLFSSRILDDDQYSDGIRSYLSDKYKLKDDHYTITRMEKGVIPMEDRRYSSWYCPHVLNAGTVGGLTKPTTGYTFRRIHNKCRDIIEALEQGLPIPDQPASSYRFRVYDIMLLNILTKDPNMSIRIFDDLFKKNDFDLILDFLDEGTQIQQELAIFSSLPYLPFFKSIYEMKHRIFTGA